MSPSCEIVREDVGSSKEERDGGRTGRGVTKELEG
jgi:hypothetical protein